MQGKSLRFSLLMCFSVLMVLGSSLSYAAKSVSVSEVSRRQLLMKMKNNADNMRSFCSGMYKCLDIKYEACTDVDMKPWPKIEYNNEFCAPYKEIVKRGFSTDIKAPMMTDLFMRLGRQYRAIYESEGTLPLEVNEITFLFDNMPFTADLINAYLESEYTLEYNSTNRRYFSGGNGHGLSGDFYWALQDSAGVKPMLRNMFFGYGYAQILKWSLKGTAVAFLDMDLVAPRTLKYKLTAVVTISRRRHRCTTRAIVNLLRKMLNCGLPKISAISRNSIRLFRAPLGNSGMLNALNVVKWNLALRSRSLGRQNRENLRNLLILPISKQILLSKRTRK